MTKRFAMPRYLGLLLIVAAGAAAIGYYAGRQPHQDASRTTPPVRAESGIDHLDEARSAKTLWVCPMHSHILQDHAGT